MANLSVECDDKNLEILSTQLQRKKVNLVIEMGNTTICFEEKLCRKAFIL